MEGAFEAHEDIIYRELWKQVMPYFNKNTDYGTRKDKIFFSLINFLDDQEQHWIWDKVKSDQTLDPNTFFEYLSEQIYQQSLFMEKKVFNKNIGVEEVVMVKMKEPQYETPKWIKGKSIKTENKILVRYTTDGRIAIKGFTEGIILSNEDYKNFKEALNLDLNTLTLPALHILINDYKLDPKNPFWKDFPTLKVFYEDLLTELGKSSTEKEKTSVVQKYVIGKGFQREKKIKNLGEDTLDVFDGV